MRARGAGVICFFRWIRWTWLIDLFMLIPLWFRPDSKCHFCHAFLCWSYLVHLACIYMFLIQELHFLFEFIRFMLVQAIKLSCWHKKKMRYEINFWFCFDRSSTLKCIQFPIISYNVTCIYFSPQKQHTYSQYIATNWVPQNLNK